MSPSRSAFGAAPAAAPPAAGHRRLAGAGLDTPADAGTGLTPRISVVVPTCRRPELLARCLQALLAQTLPQSAYEIVVVDDGPSPATQERVERLAATLPPQTLRYLQADHANGRGPAAARNQGWRAARGGLVAFTDDDTVPMDDWLASGEAAMRQGRWAALGGRVAVPLPTTSAGYRMTDHERMTQGLERTEFVTANAFVRRDALQRVGGFDESFTRAWREDTDLQLRLQQQPGGVGRAEQAVVLHPARAERWGVSLRQQKNAFFEALLYRKHPRDYRARADGTPPWPYYAIVLATAAGAGLALAGSFGAAAVCALLALLLVLRFAAQRLRGTARTPRHVGEMLATSVVIPFLSVYWRLRGALHFRVWFV